MASTMALSAPSSRQSVSVRRSSVVLPCMALIRSFSTAAPPERRLPSRSSSCSDRLTPRPLNTLCRPSLPSPTRCSDTRRKLLIRPCVRRPWPMATAPALPMGFWLRSSSHNGAAPGAGSAEPRADAPVAPMPHRGSSSTWRRGEDLSASASAAAPSSPMRLLPRSRCRSAAEPATPAASALAPAGPSAQHRRSSVARTGERLRSFASATGPSPSPNALELSSRRAIGSLTDSRVADGCKDELPPCALNDMPRLDRSLLLALAERATEKLFTGDPTSLDIFIKRCCSGDVPLEKERLCGESPPPRPSSKLPVRPKPPPLPPKRLGLAGPLEVAAAAIAIASASWATLFPSAPTSLSTSSVSPDDSIRPSSFASAITPLDPKLIWRLSSNLRSVLLPVRASPSAAANFTPMFPPACVSSSSVGPRVTVRSSTVRLDFNAPASNAQPSGVVFAVGAVDTSTVDTARLTLSVSASALRPLSLPQNVCAPVNDNTRCVTTTPERISLVVASALSCSTA
mmetsp:Transcript_2939/g.7952  ORF Transcript_2939/g.7952 Transcript_2939/m.7952 type:complete len:514 (-) Transcript_2939:1108-2649(-)